MPDTILPRQPSQEIMLLDLVERLDKFREDRICLYLHLSNLSPAYRRERYLRMAFEIFSSSVRFFEGQLFALANSDIVFVAHDVNIAMLDASVNRLRVLFGEDPLVQRHGHKKKDGFCSWYNLETDYDEFLGIARRILKKASQPHAPSDSPSDSDQLVSRGPIRPELLGKLETLLAKTDVTNLVRRQMVCTLIEDSPPETLFEEIFISIEDLQNLTLPEVDLAGSGWLFRYLTLTLDKRLMSMMVHDGIGIERPFSLNLNVATILSPEFMRFESIITPQLRGRLVIELNKLDVFSDMGAFTFARDYLRDRGFRLCLDGLTQHTLPYYDRARLGFDLIKIFWTPDSIDHLDPSMYPAIREMVMDAGQARTILCRCDNQRAIDVGQELGIIMFQGRQIDRLLGRLARKKTP